MSAGISFFRYPGGKSKLRDQIARQLAEQATPGGLEYREPPGSAWAASHPQAPASHSRTWGDQALASTSAASLAAGRPSPAQRVLQRQQSSLQGRTSNRSLLSFQHSPLSGRFQRMIRWQLVLSVRHQSRSNPDSQPSIVASEALRSSSRSPMTVTNRAEGIDQICQTPWYSGAAFLSGMPLRWVVRWDSHVEQTPDRPRLLAGTVCGGAYAGSEKRVVFRHVSEYGWINGNTIQMVTELLHRLRLQALYPLCRGPPIIFCREP
jgi:hypothetical protein